ncbi:SH3 domain-containing protein [Aliidongia dinghuensis]|uniref:SH3 domain-containing protein n=1 Tax=Aliidongia dinghuensis TaxID=1867774 RepID=UPI001E57A331|nr:SH3 domain-containing protein [Aliidongia dinghuensis]
MERSGLWGSVARVTAGVIVLAMLACGTGLAADKIPRPKVKPPVPPATQPAPPPAANAPTANAPSATGGDGKTPPAAADKPKADKPARSSHETGLPTPRFASMRKGEANLRVGPGYRFPIDWVLTRKDMPVEILAENDVWRQIRDWEGTVGWVLSSQLSGRRMVIVKGQVGTLRSDPAATAAPVAHIEPGVIGKLMECPVPGDWCRVEVEDIRGWIPRSEVFGVYPNEAYPAP